MYWSAVADFYFDLSKEVCYALILNFKYFFFHWLYFFILQGEDKTLVLQDGVLKWREYFVVSTTVDQNDSRFQIITSAFLSDPAATTC